MNLRNTTATLLFCLLSFFLTAQMRQTDYAAKWKAIDSLVNKKGLTQSALSEVNKIYALARQEKNDAQLIRALIYRINLQESTREDAVQSSIDDLEKEIASATQPARSILQSLLADIYWNYFQQHRWQLYNRTKTVGLIKKDITTLDAPDFHKKIGELYLSSLQSETILRQKRLDIYEPILNKGNTRNLRPTLFDLLAHRALDYFKTDEQDVNKPAYAFEIDDTAAFSGASVFAAHSFRTADSLSLHFKALQLFQRLIAMHLPDPNPEALLDVDIERLNFVNAYAVTGDKETMYMKSLARLTDRYGNEPAAAEAWYLQAQQYASLASRYDPINDTSHRYDYLKAKAICEKVLAQGTEKDHNEGKTHCDILLKSIRQKSLVLQLEKVNLPDQPFRSLVSWRNIAHLYARVIRVDPSTKDNLGTNTWQEEYWKKLLQLPSLRTFDQVLPETGDYQPHRAEIKIDALPIGEYILLTSTDKEFSLTGNPLLVQFFHISSIAYINNADDYFVLNRESGQPLARALVQVWNQRYDYKTNKNSLDRGEVYQTDPNGHFLMTTKDDPAGRNGNNGNWQSLLEITMPGDHFFLRDQPATIYYRNEEGDNTIDKPRYEKDNLRTFFFTDRSIYRPGQPLYFKGITVTRDFNTRQVKTVTAFKTKVFLYNANGEKVDSLELSTNEFGSYHGKFVLPEHLLNGSFYIEDDSTGNTNYFSVEEYKRPKFNVDYERLKGSYRVGDTIRVKGEAKAYAGNNIDGATVKYRVLRETRYPYFGFRYRRPGPIATNGQEIAHGTINTDAEGKFTVVFTALADLAIRKESDPVFNYRVSVDVTDINGETRSKETTVQVGYKVLELSIKMPLEDHLPADSLRALTVLSANLSGEPEPADVQLAIYRLRAPDRLIRERLWLEPDQFLIPEKDYHTIFPHDEYRNELNKETWEKEEQPVATSGKLPAASQQLAVIPDTNGKSGNVRYLLQGGNLTSGWYVIEARSKDKYGQEVKSLRYIELYDGKTGKPASPQYNWAVQEQQTVEPGEKASVHVGSSAGSLFVIRKVEHTTENGQQEGQAIGAVQFSYLTLDKERKQVEFPVAGSDRGGFGVVDAFVKDNRVYINQQVVNVPWTNKLLTIHYNSFRDKTLPGSEEKWQVTIKGYKTDKVAAEVLATMYDASLDQFKPHDWPIPDLYPSYASQIPWSSAGNFSVVGSQARYHNESLQTPYVKTYDKILPFTNGQMIRIRGGAGIAYDRTAAPQNLGMALERRAPGMAVTSDSSNVQYNFATRRSKKMVVSDVQLEDIEEEEEPPAPDRPAPSNPSPVQVRKDFKETAFFFPDLRTDSAGNISFSFTMPEALTRWKSMMLAHTRDLSVGYSEKTLVTQKQLMVQPNAPRFLREGDRMELSAKVVNLTGSELTGQVELQLTDPTNGKTADGVFTNRQPNQYFTVAAGQSSVVSFPLDIPYQYNRPLSYRIIARSAIPQPGGGKEEVSDGEEAILPVVSNRMLVTETLPLNMPGDGTRSFTFDKLLKSGNSETLSQYALTVEFTANPAWYAVQALPYLMEYPYECAEQTFNRFYANALASKIANSSPRIRQIFEKWKTADTTALLSNLEKNQELKSALLEESPWVLQGKNESQQKKNIALLFDMVRMSRELSSSIDKLQSMQAPNGGFVWFKGGPDDRYITQYILTGIGRLRKLKALPAAAEEKIKAIVTAALPYLDQQIKKDYEQVQKQEKATASGIKRSEWISETAVQYLYMRTFFSDYGIPGDAFPAVNYYRKLTQRLWIQTSRYMQGMIALSLYRTGDIRTAKGIITSLQQNAIRDAEKGMYWKGMEGGYYWYQAPVEMQSLLIEAFHEISGNTNIDGELRTWLLRQKQTHSWRTTTATADACYALLLGDEDWLHAEKDVEIRLGEKIVTSKGGDTGEDIHTAQGNEIVPQAGTGYFKKVFDGPFVNPSMGNITVTVTSHPEDGSAGKNGGIPGSKTAGTPAWGAVYWQYFDNLDKITPPGGTKTALRLVKKIFVERNTDRGPVLEPVAENGTLHVGDKVKVRIELQADRDLEYVHMKDSRASCMEPVNVLSGYKWQDGLGYYESTKDVSTDFFFPRLPRGTYIFEYPLFVQQTGNFSNGIAGIECMYAPEFAFHSEGIRVNVEARNNE